MTSSKEWREGKAARRRGTEGEERFAYKWSEVMESSEGCCEGRAGR